MDNEDNVAANVAYTDIINPISAAKVSIPTLSIPAQVIPDNSITNAQLQTITAPGKVENSATTAVETNTPGAIVSRGADGTSQFSGVYAPQMGNPFGNINLLGGTVVVYTGLFATDSIIAKNADLELSAATVEGSVIMNSRLAVAPLGIIANEINTDLQLQGNGFGKVLLNSPTTASSGSPLTVDSITATTANTSLSIAGSGSGKVLINTPASVSSGNPLTVDSITATTANMSLSISGSGTGKVLINTPATIASGKQLTTDNITATTTNTALSISGNSTGSVQVGSTELQFTNGSITGYTPSSINQFEIYVMATTASGPFTLAVNVTFTFMRLGGPSGAACLVSWSDCFGACSTSAVIVVAATIPARFRPVTTAARLISMGLNNGTNLASPCCWDINPASTGTIKGILNFNSPNNFGPSGLCGFYSGCGSWAVA